MDGVRPGALARLFAEMIELRYLSLSPLLLLVACGGEPPAPAPSATPSTTASPVALPPSIAASKTYRCSDRSVLAVDWLSDGRSANMVVGEGGPRVHVEAVLPGSPMNGSGHTLRGSKDAASVTLTAPGSPRSLVCKA